MNPTPDQHPDDSPDSTTTLTPVAVVTAAAEGDKVQDVEGIESKEIVLLEAGTDPAGRDSEEIQVIEDGPSAEVVNDKGVGGDFEAGQSSAKGDSLHVSEPFDTGNQAQETQEVEFRDEERTRSDKVETAQFDAQLPDVGDLAGQSPSALSVPLRAPTPSSRTSTPPLTAGNSLPSAKKFSSINVNKKFLSKTAVAGPSSGITKLSTLGRPSTSPAPVAAPSKLLSTKLITVTKPAPAVSAPQSSTNSPWAKTTLSPVRPIATSTPIQQPAPLRSRPIPSAVAIMGQGQVSASPNAWKITPGSKGVPLLGRDFPTAHEVADGKRAAALAAQAQAAHNEAIIQGLNVFTQLDPNAHRWDDDDDDDDVLDFGNGTVVTHKTSSPLRETVNSDPVPHGERFAEDFDRSWPPKQAVRPAPSKDDKVLFNASSNRLEAPRPARPPQQQPTRVLQRPEQAANLRAGERAVPPHMIASTAERAVPPHMHAVTSERVLSSGNPAQPGRPTDSSAESHTTGRQGWAKIRADDRDLLSSQDSQPSTSIRSPVDSANAVPSRRAGAPSQTTSTRSETSSSKINLPLAAPKQHVAPLATSTNGPLSSQTPSGPDAQTAEMHSAAEKARLRRLAEEAEREAIAERARKKARELEEKLGIKPVAPHDSTPTIHALPPSPKYTLAQRPLQAPLVSAQPPGLDQPSRPADPKTTDSWRSQAPPAIIASASLQARPGPSQDSATAPMHDEIISMTVPELGGSKPHSKPNSRGPAPVGISKGGPLADGSSGTAPVSGTPQDASVFDDMLVRIKAAMTATRIPEPPTEPAPAVTDLAPEIFLPTTNSVASYFNVTQTDLPRTPPPAWRTYTVRLPKQGPSIRLTSSSRTLIARPDGWQLSFDPPICMVSPAVSLAETLLPQVEHRRPHGEPVVSISPRTFVPFLRKKKRISMAANRPEVIQPSAAATELLLLPQATQASDEWRNAKATPSLAKSQTSHPTVPEPAVKTSSDPVNTAQPSAKTSKSAPTEISSSSGVRFMVSSELEGDSLLDEVNKMSLESMLEADPAAYHSRADARSSNHVSYAPDAIKSPETSSTPVLLNNASSRARPTTSPAPGGSADVWAPHASNLKNVWSHALDPLSEPTSTQTQQAADLSTPLYPSLNTSDPKPALAASTSYPSQGISPPSTYSALRSSPTYQFTQQNGHGMGLGYSTARPSGNHQALWSTSAFGPSMASPGYGYPGKASTNVDQKAALAFNSATVNRKEYPYTANGSHAAPVANYSHSAYMSTQYPTGGHQTHAASRSPSAQYGYPYVGGNPTSARAVSTNSSGNSRFGQSNGLEYGYNVMDGGYHGGVPMPGREAQQGHLPAVSGTGYGYVTGGGIGGGPSQAQSRNQGRKMW